MSMSTNNHSPIASSASPPSSTESPVKKQIKLAIQKEPPARPKAMADPNFLSSLRESKKYPNTRPIYNVDKILEGFGNKPGKATTETSLKRQEPSSTAAEADSSKRKRVRFKDNLVEIREYEKNPEEWTNFVSIDIVLNNASCSFILYRIRLELVWSINMAMPVIWM